MKKRLFIAIEIPESVKQEIVQLQNNLRNKIQATWVKPDDMHLTLVFIGDTDYNQIPDILECLEKVKVERFSISFDKLDGFPNINNAYSLWLGFEKYNRLLSLHKQIYNKLSNLKISCDSRVFCPHVILARLKTKKNLKEFIKTKVDINTFNVDNYSLFDSVQDLVIRKHIIIKKYHIK